MFKPISFQPNWDSGIPYGVTVRDYMEKLPLDSWQNKIRYYRLSKGISHNVMAKRLGMKNGMSYTKKYETGYAYYTTVENYYKVCNALGIEYEDIADDYMLFIASDYDVKLAKAIEMLGLSSKAFAEKYNIEYTTLRHSLKKMHKLSIETYMKYKRIFEELNL